MSRIELDTTIGVARRKVTEAARAVEQVERELTQRSEALQRDLAEAAAMRTQVEQMATSMRRLESVGAATGEGG